MLSGFFEINLKTANLRMYHRLVKNHAKRAFSLAEVMVSLGIITLVAASAYAFMHQLSVQNLRDCYQAEAYRLAQEKIEALKAGDWRTDFVSSATQTIASSTTTTFNNSSLELFNYSNTTSSARIQFERTVIEDATIENENPFFKVLRVEVKWHFYNRDYRISIPVGRAYTS
jgi:prepilin-type N-terminal cleavage/methylation domain-containing protein